MLSLARSASLVKYVVLSHLRPRLRAPTRLECATLDLWCAGRQAIKRSPRTDWSYHVLGKRAGINSRVPVLTLSHPPSSTTVEESEHRAWSPRVHRALVRSVTQRETCII